MKPTIAILDAPTGKMTHREMTDDEFVEYQTRVQIAETEQAKKFEAEKTLLAIKNSARTKLAGLGLTDAELAALLEV